MGHKKSGLAAWELTMMALGTVIGGSFFLGASVAIRAAGPAILLAYLLGGALVYFILFALSEMTVADNDPGSFRAFAHRSFGEGAGFVVGWVYWTGLILAMSSEAVAVSVFFRVWFPRLSLPVLGSAVIVLVTAANLFGAEKLSKLEGSLAAVKIAAIAGFIVLALALIAGFFPGNPAAGLGALTAEPFFPAGIGGIAGSMLIVIFTYAGFEVIGLAAAESRDSHRTVPRAIRHTILALVGLYVAAIALLLPLIPTSRLSAEISPFVAALESAGIFWAASIINIVLVTAILSTMLAATFGLGRMMRSLADEGHAPAFVRDSGEVPYRGILFSGAAMLAALGASFMLPKQVYLFLVSSGGFSLLFTYLVILATHYRFRKSHGCPPKGNCQLPGYPYTSLASIAFLIIIIASMPLIPGQAAGLIAGVGLVLFYMACYLVMRYAKTHHLRPGYRRR